MIFKASRRTSNAQYCLAMTIFPTLTAAMTKTDTQKNRGAKQPPHSDPDHKPPRDKQKPLECALTWDVTSDLSLDLALAPYETPWGYEASRNPLKFCYPGFSNFGLWRLSGFIFGFGLGFDLGFDFGFDLGFDLGLTLDLA